VKYFRERSQNHESEGERNFEPSEKDRATHVLIPLDVLEAMEQVEYSFNKLFNITADSPWGAQILQKENVIASAGELRSKLASWRRRESWNERDRDST
jgi:hypothetical protein